MHRAGERADEMRSVTPEAQESRGPPENVAVSDFTVNVAHDQHAHASDGQQLQSHQETGTKINVGSQYLHHLTVHALVSALTASNLFGVPLKATMAPVFAIDAVICWLIAKKLSVLNKIQVLQDMEYQFDEKLSKAVYYVQYADMAVFAAFKAAIIVWHSDETPRAQEAVIPGCVLAYLFVRNFVVIALQWYESTSIMSEIIGQAFRVLVVLQYVFVCVKYKGAMRTTTWWQVFACSWAASGIVSCVVLGFVILICSKFLPHVTGRSSAVTRVIERKQMIGMTWLALLTQGIAVEIALCARTLVGVMTDDDSARAWVKQNFYYSAAMLTAVTLYVVLFWREIADFMYSVNAEQASLLDESSHQELPMHSATSENAEAHKKRAKRLKKIEKAGDAFPLFIQKLSSTYFKFVANNMGGGASQNNSMIMRVREQGVVSNADGGVGGRRDDGSGDSPEENNKKNLFTNSVIMTSEQNEVVLHSGTKANKTLPHSTRSDYDLEKVNLDDLQNTEELKTSHPLKQMAHETTSKMNEILSSPKTKQIIKRESQRRQLQRREQILKSFSEQKHTRKSPNAPASPRRLFEKKNFETTDKRRIELNENNNLDQSNSACVICFDRTPDAVYTPCGHGGICYECAVDLLKRSEECYLCRENVSEIYQIDVLSRSGKKFKVLAQTVLVDESQAVSGELREV